MHSGNFGSVQDLRDWLEQQQAGYGAKAESLWAIGGRTFATIRSASIEDLERVGFLLLEARHLHDKLSPGAAVRREDCTLAYVHNVLSMQGQPPSFVILPASLPLLNAPLPLRPLGLQYISASSFNPDRLRLLAVNVEEQQQPAIVLADGISSPIWSPKVGRGESMVPMDTLGLVLDPMCWVLKVLGISFELGGDVSDPSGATESQKRPDGLLFLRDVLMFKVEAKVRDNDYDIAVAELRDKMANWTPGLHGTREYMLCCAAAGKRLRFFAVMRGGVDWRAVSREFDRTLPLDRLEIVHTALAAFNIVMQQYSQQLSAEPLPLNVTKRHNHSSITYRATYVNKVVEWASFAHADEAGLMQVYQCIMSLPLGAGLMHPQGLLKPMRLPQLESGRWHVRMPLASHSRPRSEEDLRRLVVDVLHGLISLHGLGIVHRDVRAPNILQTVGGAYVLIDFEHSGQADAVPIFQPLTHWPQECQLSSATYSKAADLFSLGSVMRSYPLRLSTHAESLSKVLMHADPAMRPSAQQALQDPWLAAF